MGQRAEGQSELVRDRSARGLAEWNGDEMNAGDGVGPISPGVKVVGAEVIGAEVVGVEAAGVQTVGLAAVGDQGAGAPVKQPTGGS